MAVTDTTQAVILPGCSAVALREAARWGIADALIVTRDGNDAGLLDQRLPVRLAVLPLADGEGTGGALRRVRDRLAPRFMLLSGEAFPDDFGPVLTGFAGDGNRVFGRLAVRPDPPPPGRPGIRTLGNRVAAFAPDAPHADGGVALLYRETVDAARDTDDMLADVLPGLARRGLLRVTVGPSWATGEPRPALLISWDKVLRIRVGNRPDEWARGAQAAIGHANRAGWHVFAVSAHDITPALPALREAGMTIDGHGPDAAALLRAWGARVEDSVIVGPPGMPAPDGVAVRSAMGGDIGALVAGILRAR